MWSEQGHPALSCLVHIQTEAPDPQLPGAHMRLAPPEQLWLGKGPLWSGAAQGHILGLGTGRAWGREALPRLRATLLKVALPWGCLAF